MTRQTRAKGYAYEAEVGRVWSGAGHRVEQLQRNRADTLDHLIVTPAGVVLYEDTKRRERLDVPGWWRELAATTPANGIPVLTFRQSRRESLSVMRTADLARLLAGRPS